MGLHATKKHAGSRDYVISLFAGIFVGAALFGAFNEAADNLGATIAILWLVIGILVWWLQEMLLHKIEKPKMPVLVATAFWYHAVLEGIAIGLAFGVLRSLGYLVAAAIILHLLPEFFAAYGLMRGAGSTSRASMTTVVIGYVALFTGFLFSYNFLPRIETALPYAIALAGGAFLYVGFKSFWPRRSWLAALFFAIGTLIPYIQSILR